MMADLHEVASKTPAASWWLDNPVAPDWPFHNFWAHWAVFSVGILAIVLGMVMVFIWFERRFMGPFQLRIGPNRAGPFGILQPVADALKIMTKEDIVPDSADKAVHFLAPILIFFAILLTFAVVPVQNGVGLIPDLNVGLLFIVAVGSIETIAVFMAGYGSNNKYSIIGAMRSVAIMVSYEMPMALAVIAVVLVTGTLSLQGIVGNQSVPFALLLPMSFIFYFICAMAELQRTPFDLLEADSEIVAGYHIEYSGMKFAMFYLAEYAGAIVQCALITLLFLGGWKGPIFPPFLWFVFKVFAVFSFVIWTRMTWPRVRIDQLMAFAWKYMLPLSVVNLLVVATETIFWEPVQWGLVPINIAIAVVLMTGWAAMFRLKDGRRFRLVPVGIGLMQGLWVTLKHATRKRITEQYPEERLTVSKRTRGQELIWDRTACTACTACVLACPHGVIKMKTSRGADNKKVVDEYECDEGLCIFCGLCVEACPFNALFFGRSYERSRYRGNFVARAEDLSSPEKEKSAYFKPELEKDLPEQELLIYRKHKRLL